MGHNCTQHNDCVEDALSKAQIICRDQKLAFTPIRQKVLELIWNNGHRAIKAYDLLETLQKDEPSAKPITIYRALDFLLEHRLIHKLESQNSFIGCNHPTRQHNCAFLICNHCNEITECCNNEKIVDTVAANPALKGFQVESITLEIHGTCPNCLH